MEYKVGDIVKLKKPHPCGSSEWEILRVGADFRLKCLGCGHQVMIPGDFGRRMKIEKLDDFKLQDTGKRKTCCILGLFCAVSTKKVKIKC